MTDDHQDAVRKQLLDAAVEMPDDVAARLEAVLRREARTRGGSNLAEEAKADFVQLVGNSSRGTFGANLPKAYDRRSIGIELHDDEHHPHAGRQLLD